MINNHLKIQERLKEAAKTVFITATDPDNVKKMTEKAMDTVTYTAVGSLTLGFIGGVAGLFVGGPAGAVIGATAGVKGGAVAGGVVGGNISNLS